MDDEWVTPQMAVDRLVARHFKPSRQKGDSRNKVRMALIGALRAGIIGWRCQTWHERYTSDRDAIYDENGGPTAEEPRHGFPADFWQPALADDDTFWSNNIFVSYGTASLEDAPYKVRLWLGANSEARAQWCRSANTVALRWSDVTGVLGSTGWKVWIAKAHSARRLPKRSWHYEDALVRMIGVAVRSPNALSDRASIHDRLVEAFQIYGEAPDTRELERLCKAIDSELRWLGEDAPPTI